MEWKRCHTGVSPKGKLFLRSCAVTSVSGRVLTLQNGAHAVVEDSAIHKCIATGIYVGGSCSRGKSHLTVDSSDICANGGKHGSRLGRGHSGICLAEDAYANVPSRICVTTMPMVWQLCQTTNTPMREWKSAIWRRTGPVERALQKGGIIEKCGSTTLAKTVPKSSVLRESICSCIPGIERQG
mgnify:CR=1 FL=1